MVSHNSSRIPNSETQQHQHLNPLLIPVVFKHVLAFLDPEDIVQCRAVCKCWYDWIPRDLLTGPDVSKIFFPNGPYVLRRNRETSRPKSEIVCKKLVIIGDSKTGKTSLLYACTRGKFPTDYIPSVFGVYVAEVSAAGKSVELALWDTSGGIEYDRLRPLSYPDSDVVILCFSVDRPESLTRILVKLNPEINNFCSTNGHSVIKILLGTKTDLREDPSTIRKLASYDYKPVSSEEGREIAELIGAFAYLECSAKTLEGVREVFPTVVRGAIQYKLKNTPLTSLKNKINNAKLRSCRGISSCLDCLSGYSVTVLICLASSFCVPLCCLRSYFLGNPPEDSDDEGDY